MKNASRIKSLKTMLYIVCFIAGIAIFVYMADYIEVPVYETVQGIVNIREGEAFIEIQSEVKMQNSCENNHVDRIYYYINRDEWVQCESEYVVENKGIRIDNVHNLEDKTRVYIDVEVGKMTLLEMILKGGKV